MPYISVSNIKVEEVIIEQSDGEFAIVELSSTHARICIRKTRIYDDKTILEKKLGLYGDCTPVRPPYAYFH